MSAWQPLQPAQPIGDLEAFHRAMGADALMFKNNRYTVTVRHLRQEGAPRGVVTHLSIRRNDRKPLRDWRDLQRIKNDLCGPEAEGVELFPAESRLLDASNQYHLWVYYGRLAHGIPCDRQVGDADQATAEGAVQRPPPAPAPIVEWCRDDLTNTWRSDPMPPIGTLPAGNYLVRVQARPDQQETP